MSNSLTIHQNEYYDSITCLLQDLRVGDCFTYDGRVQCVHEKPLNVEEGIIVRHLHASEARFHRMQPRVMVTCLVNPYFTHEPWYYKPYNNVMPGSVFIFAPNTALCVRSMKGHTFLNSGNTGISYPENPFVWEVPANLYFGLPTSIH